MSLVYTGITPAMFTYEVTNAISVHTGLDFEEATVGGLQNLFLWVLAVKQKGFSDWVMQDVSHRSMIHPLVHSLSFSLSPLLNSVSVLYLFPVRVQEVTRNKTLATVYLLV